MLVSGHERDGWMGGGSTLSRKSWLREGRQGRSER